MVDASIGGKTGIDMGPYKNQLGTFADPKAIFIDPRFLHSLPSEEIVNGFAEMMKHALIADADHWIVLQEIRPELLLEQDNLIELIAHSVRIKSEIVEKDPTEKGPRKLLNFGHTIGHGIEGYFLENEAPIAHGHAVALGILTESYLSFKAGGLTSEELSRIISAVVTNFAAVNIDEIARKRILELMYNDKKNRGNRILGVLLQGIGSAVWDQEYQEMDVLEALMFLEDCYQAE
jgi:3-dehydroquinate synthase